MEIVIALVIVAILGAVLYPSVGMQLRRGQSSALANQLDAIRTAAENYHANVQRWPATLANLTNQPGAGSTDLCGTALPAANQALWRGPYLTQNISGNVPIGDATLQNFILRNPFTGVGLPGTMQIQVTTVDSVSAADLERQFDGTVLNYGAGTILWTPITTPTGTLTFQIPIRGC